MPACGGFGAGRCCIGIEKRGGEMQRRTRKRNALARVAHSDFGSKGGLFFPEIAEI